MNNVDTLKAADAEIQPILDRYGLIIPGGAVANLTTPATTKPAFSAYSWNYAEPKTGSV